MKKNFTIAMTLMAVMFVMAGCKPDPVEPTVVLDEQSVVVSYNAAWIHAEVKDDGGAAVTERGFCYGEAGGELDNMVLVEDGADFMGELSGLKPATAYTCRAFAVNKVGSGYSSVFTFITENDTVLRVATGVVKEFTYHSAVVSGQVLSDGGHAITDKGICFSLSALPTVSDTCLSAGTGVGPFEVHIEGLTPDTRYYYRAYAVCSQGVFYGDQDVIDTDVLPMAVHTIGLSEVTGTRAKAAGIVIRDGGHEVTECGFCWGIQHEPDLEGLHIKAGLGMEEFSCYFSGLERGVTNYLRAYSINERGVAYGEEIAFVPDDASMPWPSGVLPGLFSVAPDRQVRFSQGNLQYYPDDNIWRFAVMQWDFVGGPIEDLYGTMDAGTVYANGKKCDNTMAYRYYEGWMDLFGWGTSGWNNGNEYYHPYDVSSMPYHTASYGPPGNFDLTGDYAEADWGIHNTISNGGSRQWRTPTVEEMVYLISERETPSGMRFAPAVVTGICGLIVLPDEWEASTYPLNAVNEHVAFGANRITASEWLEVLEPAGAVFLPAAGERLQYAIDEISYDNSVSDEYSPSGSYWSTTQSGVNIAHALMLLSFEATAPSFMSGCIYMEASRCRGRSVRLISDE